MAESGLVGREAELAELDRLFDDRASGSRALQLEGDAGVGKTAVWRAGLSVAQARSYRILTAQPVEIETKLSFAGLSDLVEPLLGDVLAGLPEPKRRALEVALLLVPGRSQPDQRGVAAAFLSLLRLAAEDRRLLIAIDDLQWLDSPSHQVVAFAARRVRTEHVRFLVARRTADGHAEPLELERALPSERLTRVQLGPMDLIALHRMVERDLGCPLPRPSLRKIHEVSQGNPFFALELARELARTHSGSGAGEDLPVPHTVRSLVRKRLRRAPPDERQVLLAVAALARPTRDLLAALAGARENGWPPLIDAFEARIVEVVDGRVRFTHPLLGSVLYADTPIPARQDMHRRLSALVADPEESARHLALSAAAPDPGVASKLEIAAGYASARGAPSSAGELLELSIGLTPPEDGSARCRRRLLAADHWTAAGDSIRAISLLESAIAESAPGCERAAVMIRQGRARRALGQGAAAAELFDQALAQGCGDPAVRVSLEKELVWSTHLLGDVREAERHAHAAVAIAEELGGQAARAETLADLAFIQMLRGNTSARATMDRALLLSQDGLEALGYWFLPSWQNALLLAWAGDLEGSRLQLEVLRVQAMERGDEHTLPSVLSWLSRVALYKGDWPAAAAHAGDAADSSVSAPGEQVFVLVSRALVEAHVGNDEAARDATDRGLALARSTGIVSAQIDHLAIRGALELSLGDLDAAHRFLAPLPAALARHGFGEPAVFRFHHDLIETLVARGDLVEARAQLVELDRSGIRLPGSWVRAATDRCHALLAAADGDDEAAFALFESALVRHDGARDRFERARTLFLYGVALRRAKRRRAARKSLDEANAIFQHLGAAIWSARTQGELARISGAGPRSAGLSETEWRIAELAIVGRTNKQIAAELHLTVRTVESNLTRVYRKHGVSSRAQLAHLIRRERDRLTTPFAEA